MKKVFAWLFNPPTDGPSAITLIRFTSGAVFFFEGILKFVYTNQGVGRFTKLGFPMPETTAHFVATGEIIGGLLLMLGLFTRFVSVYFIIQMTVAVLSTKIDVYFGTSPLPLPASPPKTGIWAVEHEIRTDYAMIMTCIFLMLQGPGRASLDFIRTKSRQIAGLVGVVRNKE